MRSAFNDRSGSAGDINLMLVMALRKAGFEAEPVILSTRQNGIINPFFPIMSTFNYVIAHVKLGNESYLLDATDPLCPVGLLPVRCLNGKGRLISEKGTDWVELNPGRTYMYLTNLDLKMDDSGNFEGTISNTRDDYAAYSLRKMLEDENSEEDFIKRIEDGNNGLSIEKFTCTNRDSIYLPLEEKYDITIGDNADIMGDIIYFNPMFFEQVKSNPFKLKERKYPIDFSYPRNEKYILTLEIPEGFEVDELPAPVNMSLPDGGATFRYAAQEVDGKIQLVNEFAVNKTVYLYDEYQQLKEFYNKMVEKHAEQVVLKRASD